jgi:glycosyltransferase involved in cell wall biosynthesis
VRVGPDLLFLVPGETGGRETYARELVRALAAERPDLELVALVNRETAAAAEDGFWSQYASVVEIGSSGVARGSWALGELWRLPRAARGLDVLHSVANFGPLYGAGARVLTVHDVLWRRLPDAVPPAMRIGTNLLVAGAARFADRVITVSDASAADIAAELRLPAGRVEVVRNGVTEPPATSPPPADVGQGTRPLALSVASDLPHKNLAALVDGLALVPPGARPVLAFAGHGTETGALRARAAEWGVEDDVRLLGAVDPERLEALYAAAAVVLTATRFEGFGLPVLEAMARGVPVACSDLPVLHEVAGDAAVWLDPASPPSISRAIQAALRDAERLRDAGRARAKDFSWGAAARATAAVYERAARRR